MADERCDADSILDLVSDRGLLFLVVANGADRRLSRCFAKPS